jgi:hypothetical protein
MIRLGFVAAGFLAVVFLFGGPYGLLFGAVLVAATLLTRVEVRWLWGLAVLLLAASPFALMAQGLPSGPVVGPGFGTDHMLAHVLVGMSLASAAWAGLLELVPGWRSFRPFGLMARRTGSGTPNALDDELEQSGGAGRGEA